MWGYEHRTGVRGGQGSVRKREAEEECREELRKDANRWVSSCSSPLAWWVLVCRRNFRAASRFHRS
jgi:hypothetical protein